MYKYIGLLQTAHGQHDEAGLSDGFMVNGSATLESLAQIYGLKPPTSESRMTVSDYLSRLNFGLPRVGDKTQWERVELVIQEMQDGAINKVRLTIRPLQERRGRVERRGYRGSMQGRSPRDRRASSRYEAR